jgi:hypothetical protein
LDATVAEQTIRFPTDLSLLKRVGKSANDWSINFLRWVR